MNRLICYAARATINRSLLSYLLNDEYEDDHFIALEVQTAAIPGESKESISTLKYYLRDIDTYRLSLLRFNDSVVCNESLEIMPSEDGSLFLGINSIIAIKNLYSAIRQQSTIRRDNKHIGITSNGMNDFISALNDLPDSSKRLYAAIIAVLKSKEQSKHLRSFQSTLNHLNKYSDIPSELEDILNSISSIHRVSSDSSCSLIESSQVSFSKRNESPELKIIISDSIADLISSIESSDKVYETISTYFKTTY